MSHYPTARAEPAEGPNTNGWSSRARGDIAVFCAMVLLAAGMVVGATAARRPPLVTVSIAGTVDLLTNPGVQQELRALGYNVVTNGLGADQILAQVPLRGYQIAYVPNQVVGTAIEQKLSGLHLQNDAIVLEEAHDSRITKDMVMMYVSPAMDVQETLIPLDNTGTTVSAELAADQRIRRIAEEKLGFITTSPYRFNQDMKKAGIAVAGGLQIANPPAYNILQDIINGLP